MREILFRGKDKNTGRWIQGGFHIWEKRMLNPIGVDYLKDDEVAYTITVNSFADWNMPRTMQAVEVVPETVGQYTGLCDKNGKKIFEGDILRGDIYPFKNVEDYNYYAEVIWFDNSPAFGIYTHKSPTSKTRGISAGNTDYLTDFTQEAWEVIGNIHDNPELLGAENPNE